MKNHKSFLFRVLLGAGSCVLLCGPGGVAQDAQDNRLRDLWQGAPPKLAAIPDSGQSKAISLPGGDKVDPRLRNLVDASQTKGIGLSGDEPEAAGLVVSDGRVAVTLQANGPEGAAKLRRMVEEQGGVVSGTLGDVILARVPVASVEKLATAAELDYLAGQGRLKPQGIPTGRVVSEGVRGTNMDRLHRRGFTGKGVKIGILDFGFEGYEKLQRAGNLPAPKATKAFNDKNKVENGEVHGAGCAEIIHAMAPDADLYLAAMGAADDEFLHGAVWLAEQGVDIISFSGGSLVGAGNGRDFDSQVVDEITNKYKILWVVAAGNDGAAHWSGMTEDKNNDHWIDIGADQKQFLAIEAKTEKLQVLVRWDDWGANPLRPASTQDIDAYLFAYDTSTKQGALAAKSTNPQQGKGAPVEMVEVKGKAHQVYLLGLRAEHVTKSMKVHVFLRTPGDIYPQSAEGSIANPGAARLSLAVAAVRVADGKLAYYSSQGPTDDQRVKPDVSAPTEVTSASYGGEFAGTSAACPHVSGFAAVMKQVNPSLSATSLRDAVMRAVKPQGPAAPNNQFGFGFIDAMKVPLPPGAPEETPVERPVQSGSDEGIAVPQEWGGLAPISALEKLRSQARPEVDGLSVKVVTGHDSYRIGDGMKIAYRTSRDSYYLLFHRDNKGKYTLVAPQFFGGAKLSGGSSYTLPGGGMAIIVTEPIGKEEFLLIGGTAPVDLRRVGDGAGRNLAISIARYDVVPAGR